MSITIALSLGGLVGGAVSACDRASDAPDGGTDAASVDARTPDAPPMEPTDASSALDQGLGGDAFVSPRASGYASFRPVGPREPRYIAEGSTVTDEHTGLVWERVAGTALLTFEEARARCDALSLDGHDDFRVPSRVELVSLLRTTRSPTIDPTFLDTDPEYHWTRSLHPRRDASATSVYFGAAEIVFALVADRSALVRCVRGVSEGEGPTREPSGAVVDRGTQLVWSVLPTQRTYEEAVRDCEAASSRVPTLDELASLVDDARSMPAIDLEVLGGEAGPTWSSSEAQTSGERIGLDLSIGPSVRLRETERAWARCVTEAP